MTTRMQKKISKELDVLAARIDRARQYLEAGDAVGLVENVAAFGGELAEVTVLAVQYGRAHGMSWAEVAEPFGVTRQAAQQYWGDPS
jgi:hypothetical protein